MLASDIADWLDFLRANFGVVDVTEDLSAEGSGIPCSAVFSSIGSSDIMLLILTKLSLYFLASSFLCVSFRVVVVSAISLSLKTGISALLRPLLLWPGANLEETKLPSSMIRSRTVSGKRLLTIASDRLTDLSSDICCRCTRKS